MLVVIVPCGVGAVGTLDMMRVMLFVWEVSMLRGCEGDDNVGVGTGGGVVAVSEWCEYMGGTHCSGVVLNMSMMRGVRGVGGKCEMCMCLACVGGVGVSM